MSIDLTVVAGGSIDGDVISTVNVVQLKVHIRPAVFSQTGSDVNRIAQGDTTVRAIGVVRVEHNVIARIDVKGADRDVGVFTAIMDVHIDVVRSTDHHVANTDVGIIVRTAEISVVVGDIKINIVRSRHAEVTHIDVSTRVVVRDAELGIVIGSDGHLVDGSSARNRVTVDVQVHTHAHERSIVEVDVEVRVVASRQGDIAGDGDPGVIIAINVQIGIIICSDRLAVITQDQDAAVVVV